LTEVHSETSQVNLVRTLADNLRAELAKRIFGLEGEVALLMATVVAGRHVLMEGVPGLGKTLLLKTLADALGCEFRRIQFTPDLLPADILGGYVYDSRDGSFKLRKGPIFANMILADEINRAPAKTQSALLEVMQEGQVTIEGETLLMPSPFFVFATQNPLEHEGVYPLPQAQLDRFSMRLLMNYPGPAAERKILAACREPLPDIRAVADPTSVIAAQEIAAKISVSDEIIEIVAKLVRVTREHDGVAHGASPRVGVDLMFLSRARAVLSGRTRVIPDDIKALFPHAANHRMILTPQAEIGGMTMSRVITDSLKATRLV